MVTIFSLRLSFLHHIKTPHLKYVPTSLASLCANPPCMSVETKREAPLRSSSSEREAENARANGANRRPDVPQDITQPQTTQPKHALVAAFMPFEAGVLLMMGAAGR